MQDNLPPSLAKRTPKWQIIMNWSLPFVLIAVFAWQVHDCKWTDIKTQLEQMNWALVAGALLLLLVNSLLEILIWNKTLSWFTEPLSFIKATPVYIWSSLARYIPGKIASLIVRVALATEVKREVIPVLASSTVELALRIASGSLLLLVALFSAGVTEQKGYIIAPLIAIPLVLICAHPRIMLPVMNWALKKIKQQPITRTLSYADVLLIFLTIIGRWVIYGAAFAMLVCALSPSIGPQQFVVLMCLAAGSWAIGFILLSPGGLGVAETLQLLILKELGFSDSLSAILPMLFRLGSLSAEGLWAMVSVFMRRTWKTEVPEPQTKQVIG